MRSGGPSPTGFVTSRDALAVSHRSDEVLAALRREEDCEAGVVRHRQPCRARSFTGASGTTPSTTPPREPELSEASTRAYENIPWAIARSNPNARADSAWR